MASNIKMAAFWVAALCNLQAAGMSETSVKFYHSTCRSNPQDSYLYRTKSLKDAVNKPRIASTVTSRISDVGCDKINTDKTCI
jgi:hypothetical protein